MSNADKTCECGEPIAYNCVRCKRGVCDDVSCGTETVDGFLCGTYTQWGCGRKYTTCDECMEDEAIHEDDMFHCEECGNSYCKECGEEHDCGSETDTEVVTQENQQENQQQE